MAWIIWKKGYRPKGRNLADILAEMDADGVGCGHEREPKPLRIVPLVHTKTTIEIDVDRPKRKGK